MTDDVKKAAEEYVRSADSWIDDGYRPHEHTFLAGDAHGFARAVKMLREKASGMATPKTWATWLEEQEKGEG